MKKFLFLLLFSIAMVFCLQARTLAIIKLITNNIEFEEGGCSVGRNFSDETIIHWILSDQEMRVKYIDGYREIFRLSKGSFIKNRTKAACGFFQKSNRSSSLSSHKTQKTNKNKNEEKPRRLKIVKLNTPSIEIGNKTCKVGSTFYDNAVIHWSTQKQEMWVKYIDGDRKKLCLSKESFSKNKIKTAKEYYLRIKHASANCY